MRYPAVDVASEELILNGLDAADVVLIICYMIHTAIACEQRREQVLVLAAAKVETDKKKACQRATISNFKNTSFEVSIFLRHSSLLSHSKAAQDYN